MTRNTFLTAACCIISLAALLYGCKSRRASNENITAEAGQDTLAVTAPDIQEEAMDTFEQLPEEPVFSIVTNMGTIKVKLYKHTPRHRENFAKLALSGYYDGLLFHRVIDGFMIQGGDPYTRDTAKVSLYGQGGPDYTIPAEIEEGMKAGYTHKKGALAAARRGDSANPLKESSGSQFYIVQDAEGCSHLDGEYTVFGETVAGLNVIDKIAAVPTNRMGLPHDEVRIISIRYDKNANLKE